jgi:hypothetical protein
MQEYIEVFRVEAKSLLKNFRNNDKNAVARCQAIFGDKIDLSLMNMQHVIAKEYGFNDWNELQKAEDWQLAEALITDAYIERFNKEMKVLAPYLKVKLEKGQSQKGRSPYKVVLDTTDKLRKSPEDVLSEG